MARRTGHPERLRLMWFSRWVAGAPVTSVGSGTGARKGMALGGRAGVAPFSVLGARGLLSEVFWEGGGGRHHQCVAYPAVTRGVSACASSVLGPQCSCVAELGSAQPCVRGVRLTRAWGGPVPACSAQPAAPALPGACTPPWAVEGGAGASESQVPPAHGRASTLFLGLHVDSLSASHAFLGVNVARC